MKILVLCDDYWHPAQTARKGLGALGSNEFSFDWVEDARNLSPQMMNSYPVVILTKSNHVSSNDQSEWMSDTVQAAFAEYVHSGNGLLAIHSGSAGYEHKTLLRSLLGGVFVNHPEQCPVTVSPRPEHLLSAGVDSFTLEDEHYFMEMDDPEADVFMTTMSEYGEQPAGWTRLVGRGRVAVLTPGHNLEVWLHPSFQALLRNCLCWCGQLL